LHCGGVWYKTSVYLNRVSNLNIYTELASLPGVIAAGEYTYRGDRYHYDGQISDEQARMASIMCRATTLAVHMQANIMKSLKADCGCAPVQGWMVRGEQFSVCVCECILLCR